VVGFWICLRKAKAFFFISFPFFCSFAALGLTFVAMLMKERERLRKKLTFLLVAFAQLSSLYENKI